MSLILTAPARLVKVRAATDPLTTAADAAVPRVRRWWRETWTAFQGLLPQEWALSSLDTLLRQAWHSISLPRLETLQSLLQRLADTVTRGELPTLSGETLGITQAVQAIETSLAQVPTTMARLPHALLPEAAVLTIPQQGALVRMAEGLAQDVTTPPAHVERTLRTQAKAQLKVRTKAMAENLAWQTAQAGQQAGWQQQGERRELAAGAKRFWRVRHDERLCSRCAAIPGLNEAGVGLDMPFQSSDGTVFSPPLHISCRCNVELS